MEVILIMEQTVHTAKKGVNPVVTGVAGVIIGATGAAMTAAMMHEPTRKKMEKTVHDIKLKVEKTLDTMREVTAKISTKEQKSPEEADH